ncbi:hypothetical protein CN106_14280 [Sinorhizobium meliloti]|nr:hypothetical protein CN127_16140 [Sinorhizobium meliloti]RVN68785.1 hypothetical protein CN106_14280 [Sinorhizobium meliloti]
MPRPATRKASKASAPIGPWPTASNREDPLHKLALKDTLPTPVGGGFRTVNVWLRKTFDAYANVRPAKTIVSGRATRISISC